MTYDFTMTLFSCVCDSLCVCVCVCVCVLWCFSLFMCEWVAVCVRRLKLFGAPFRTEHSE